MTVLLLVLVLALFFGGFGFAAHVLWLVALVLLACWIVGSMSGRRRP